MDKESVIYHLKSYINTFEGIKGEFERDPRGLDIESVKFYEGCVYSLNQLAKKLEIDLTIKDSWQEKD
jgi:hypothetical protein